MPGWQKRPKKRAFEFWDRAEGREIVQGRRSITGETALRLARYFGTSPEFWLGIQKDYDLEVARDEFAAQVER